MLTFAERLKITRKNCGLTQLTVAETLGISEGGYCAYEKGKREPNLEKLKLLANLFDVSADFLINTNKYNKNATLTPKEQELLDTFRELNEIGQEKILDNIDDLVSSKKYKVTEEYQNLQSEA